MLPQGEKVANIKEEGLVDGPPSCRRSRAVMS